MLTSKLLYLLQLSSSSLPVGAYSYSESLESLVDAHIISNATELQTWLKHSLSYGSIRIEVAIMQRAYQAVINDNLTGLNYWNNWSTAARETDELRRQSWQMGQTLINLFLSLNPGVEKLEKIAVICGDNCNFNVAFGVAAAYSEIDLEATTIGYLYSWISNLISAGVRLIPLGQTMGQKLLLEIHPHIITTTEEITNLADDDLSSFSWGLSLASMHHESLYTRLFRS